MYAKQADPTEDRSDLAAAVPADEDIVRSVLAGDNASFELIMRRYNRLLFRVARSIVGNDTEAEDVLQEAYLRAFEHLHRFQGRCRFSTWLTKIAVHEAMNRRRRLRRLGLVTSGDSGANEMVSYRVARDGLEEASLNELRNLLTTAVDSLSPELRLVFTLRMVERLSTEQTAEYLNLSASNVKIRLHRARSHLQTWINRRIGEESRQLYAFGGDRCDRVVRIVLYRLARRRD